MKLLQLDLLSKESVDSVSDSFNNLPSTGHDDGRYRLRRYSILELRTTFWNAKQEVEIDKLEAREFLQSEDLNKHQGGVSRKFEDLEDTLIESEGFKQICLNFKQCNNLVDGQEIEVHQMRIQTLDDEQSVLTKNGPWVVTPVSPEGVHQDGFDHIAMIGINRHNIEGGNLMVFDRRDADMPLLSKPLSAGDMFMLDDSRLFHDASPIKAIKRREKGYLDAFVLCAKLP
tara:strand:+ start:1161 stop:1847 length:687 start_codon:yes stop_codon:yes gene_type:complete